MQEFDSGHKKTIARKSEPTATDREGPGTCTHPTYECHSFRRFYQPDHDCKLWKMKNEDHEQNIGIGSRLSERTYDTSLHCRILGWLRGRDWVRPPVAMDWVVMDWVVMDWVAMDWVAMDWVEKGCVVMMVEEDHLLPNQPAAIRESCYEQGSWFTNNRYICDTRVVLFM